MGYVPYGESPSFDRLNASTGSARGRQPSGWPTAVAQPYHDGRVGQAPLSSAHGFAASSYPPMATQPLPRSYSPVSPRPEGRSSDGMAGTAPSSFGGGRFTGAAAAWRSQAPPLHVDELGNGAEERSGQAHHRFQQPQPYEDERSADGTSADIGREAGDEEDGDDWRMQTLQSHAKWQQVQHRHHRHAHPQQQHTPQYEVVRSQSPPQIDHHPHSDDGDEAPPGYRRFGTAPVADDERPIRQARPQQQRQRFRDDDDDGGGSLSPSRQPSSWGNDEVTLSPVGSDRRRYYEDADTLVVGSGSVVRSANPTPTLAAQLGDLTRFDVVLRDEALCARIAALARGYETRALLKTTKVQSLIRQVRTQGC